MQVSVMETPSFTNAAMARFSRSTIQSACPSSLDFAKSVPRGSVMVGMRTVRSPVECAASLSSQRTLCSPRLSVSAMMWAWVTGTNSFAPKNVPTFTWCRIAACGTGPISPASIAFSSRSSLIDSSVHLRAGLAHRLLPVRYLLALEFRQRDALGIRLHADGAELVVEMRRLHDPVDLPAQPRGDGLRQVRRTEDRPPRARLDALHTRLRERRHLRQHRRARRSAHGERAQRSRLDVRDLRLERVEHRRDLEAEEIVDRRR